MLKYRKWLVKNAVRVMVAIALPPLPYEYNALEPHISEQTLRFHHDKHFAQNVLETNRMTAKSTEMSEDDKTHKLYNNAAQVWDHDFYFKCLKKGGGGEPSGQLLDLINNHFGSYAHFRAQFEKACNNQLGSGYGWLVLNSSGALEIRSTSDAENPLTQDGAVPLLCIDLREHAYPWSSVTNLRSRYVSVVMENLVNWDFVEEQLLLAITDAAEEKFWKSQAYNKSVAPLKGCVVEDSGLEKETEKDSTAVVDGRVVTMGGWWFW